MPTQKRIELVFVLAIVGLAVVLGVKSIYRHTTTSSAPELPFWPCDCPNKRPPEPTMQRSDPAPDESPEPPLAP